MTNTVKVPPDGGYGWIIVLANALSNLIIIPLMQSFGLIFKDTFAAMGLSATQGSLIINVNAAFGMIMGLLNGLILKMFGYRKAAMLAACFISIGIILTSYATTFTHFMITYGLITSFGMGMNMSAYGLALNTYFRKNKGKAVAYAMTITGLGPIIMPQIITGLMKIYTVQGVTLILGAIAANSFVAATLLQPVKRHLKIELLVEEKSEPEDIIPEVKINTIRRGSRIESRRKASIISVTSIDEAPVFGLDSAFDGSLLSIQSVPRRASAISQRDIKEIKESLREEPLIEEVYNPELSKPKKKQNCCQRLFSSLVTFFDLDLLKNPIYVNIMMGLSLAIFAEINFSLLTAFILAELELDTNQIATFMSILGIADIIFRFLAPFIGHLLKLSARQMYTLTLFLLMTSRFSLLLSNNYYILLGVALGLGIAKGLRTVYMTLVIPMYVPIDKLPSASGLQMMVNGLCILIGGPIIGVIRDLTGSYKMCIVVLNLVTFSTITIWTIEGIVRKFKRKEELPEATELRNTLLNRT